MKWKIKTLERDRYGEREGKERERGEREGERPERPEREAKWDLKHQRYRLGLKIGHRAHCCILSHEPDLDS